MAAALPFMLATLNTIGSAAMAHPLMAAQAAMGAHRLYEGAQNGGIEGALQAAGQNIIGSKLPDFAARAVQSGRDAIGLGGEGEYAHHLMQTAPQSSQQLPGDGLDAAIKDSAAPGAPTDGSGVVHHLAPVPSSPLSTDMAESLRSGVPSVDKLGAVPLNPGAGGDKSVSIPERGPDALSRMLGNSVASAVGNAITPTASPGSPTGGGGATSFSAPARVGGGPGGGSGLPITNSTAPKIYPWVVPNDSRRIGV